jgi:hypothetical protein
MNAPAVLPPDENKTLLPLVTHAVFTPIALLVVTFRLVARWKGNGFKLDDYFMMAALVRSASSSRRLPFLTRDRCAR